MATLVAQNKKTSYKTNPTFAREYQLQIVMIKFRFTFSRVNNKRLNLKFRCYFHSQYT